MYNLILKNVKNAVTYASRSVIQVIAFARVSHLIWNILNFVEVCPLHACLCLKCDTILTVDALTSTFLLCSIHCFNHIIELKILIMFDLITFWYQIILQDVF